MSAPVEATGRSRRAWRTATGEVGRLGLPIFLAVRTTPVYGTPEYVTERLIELRETLGFSRLAVWMNSGGRVSHERVMRSLRLFADRVMPRLA